MVRSRDRVEVIPLGGLGEFGMHTMLVRCDETSIVIDAGVLFPNPDLYGVDLVVPDLSALQGKPVEAVLLTHGHEDHIGGIPYLFPHVAGNVFGTDLTLALAKKRLDEHQIDSAGRLTSVKPGDRRIIGAFDTEFIRLTHSIPSSVAIVLHTPFGAIVHTGDFNFDQTPLDGLLTDIQRLAALGSEGVLALFSDSTNIDRAGYSGSEIDVIDDLTHLARSTQGTLIVTTFSHSIHRMQVLAHVAEHSRRKIAFIGRRMSDNARAASELGYLRINPANTIGDSPMRESTTSDLLCVCTGSQGEPLAALTRMALDRHIQIRLTPQDVVVFSARQIPGNERRIGDLMSHLARRGVGIVTNRTHNVHVSGHGSAEELKLMISLLRPRFFVPVHGDYYHLSMHARTAKQVYPPTEVLLCEDGDILLFDETGGKISGKTTAGRVLIDGTGELGDEILRDRRHLSEDGLVVAVLAINPQTGALERDPDIVARGVVANAETETMLRQAPNVVANIVDGATIEQRRDESLIKEMIRLELRRFFRKRSGRRPLVLPVIMEI